MINTLTSLGGALTVPQIRTVTNASSELAALQHFSAGYGATDTGLSVTENNALTYTPVLACTRVISETLASLPCKLYVKTAEGPEVADGHYLYPILHDEPNPEMSSFSFWEAITVSLCLWNNAFAQIEWNNAGRVRALWPLLPNRVTVRRVGGRRVYDYVRDDGTVDTIAADSILHIPGCLNITGLVAESLILYARESIGLGLAPQKYAANFYRNNARPGMYLTFPQALNPDTRAEIRKGWDAVHKGINGAGTTGVIEGGGEIKIPSVAQKDAEFSITRDQQRIEACSIYRMPPHMISDLSRATFSNIEHQDIHFGKHTMTPYCKRSEQEVNRKLIGIGTGYYCEFSLDALMRGDLLSRTEANAKAIQSAQMSPNESRAKENRKRLPGGDGLYIQGATVPLELAGKLGKGATAEKRTEEK